PADGKDLTRRNADLEDLGSIAGVIQQRAGNAQMTGRRNRKEFGESLDDAEDDGDEERRLIHALSRIRRNAGDYVTPMATVNTQIGIGRQDKKVRERFGHSHQAGV